MTHRNRRTWFVLVFFVFIGLKTAIPVCCQQNAFGHIRFVLGNDIDRIEGSSLVVHGFKGLFCNCEAMPFKFLRKPGSTFLVGGRVGYPWAEIHLFLNK